MPRACLRCDVSLRLGSLSRVRESKRESFRSCCRRGAPGCGDGGLSRRCHWRFLGPGRRRSKRRQLSQRFFRSRFFGAAPATSGSAELKTCDKDLVWDNKKKKCVVKHSGTLPDADLTEYAYPLAKAGRFDETIDVLDTLQDPNTPVR
jgi:hypothetical protein